MTLLSDSTFFDTDMQLHRLSNDIHVREEAEKKFNNNYPTAISEFSLVELKGNYIACLILLRRKIHDSESLSMAYSRISSSGGRRPAMMLAQLFKWLDKQSIPINPWKELKNVLLTHLDSQIAIIWEYFKTSVDIVATDFNCTRATEAPEDNGGNWSATIHRCNKKNSNCNIEEFIGNFLPDVAALNTYLTSMKETDLTNELKKIKKNTDDILAKSKFYRGKNKCRQIGDLIIGLHSKLGIKLISSNYKEHGVLSDPLKYQYEFFDSAKIRSN